MPATSGASSPKPATPKKSPKKKATKLRVQAEGENVYFENGAQKPVAAGAEDGASDPLAEYRAAAAIAAKAIQQEKERESERQAHLLAVWDAMDRVSTGQGAGRVDMADVVEAVAKGTAPLTERAATHRPSHAVALQLPPVFTKDDFMKEMARMSGLMDDATFHDNVLGLFACFSAPAPAPAPASAPAAPPFLSLPPAPDAAEMARRAAQDSARAASARGLSPLAALEAAEKALVAVTLSARGLASARGQTSAARGVPELS